MTYQNTGVDPKRVTGAAGEEREVGTIIVDTDGPMRQ